MARPLALLLAALCCAGASAKCARRPDDLVGMLGDRCRGKQDDLARELCQLHTRLNDAYNQRDAAAAAACFAPTAERVADGHAAHGRGEIEAALEMEMDALRDTNLSLSTTPKSHDQASATFAQNKTAWDSGDWVLAREGGDPAERGRYFGLSVMDPANPAQRVYQYVHFNQDRFANGIDAGVMAISRAHQNAERDAVQHGGAACDTLARLHSEDCVVWPPPDKRGVMEPIEGREAIKRYCEERFQKHQGEMDTVYYSADRFGPADDDKQGARYEQGRYSVMKDGEAIQSGVYTHVFRRAGDAGDSDAYEIIAGAWEPEARLAADMRHVRHAAAPLRFLRRVVA